MVKELEWYRNRHEGKRLFVCGNAPSLAQDYPLLMGESVFGCNFLTYWKDLPFKPDFIGATEPWDHDGQWELMDEITRGIDHRFALGRATPEPHREDWIWLPKIQPGKGRRGMDIEGCRSEPPFSTAGTTPLNIGVQFGAFMGFGPIYIVGVELTDGHVYDLPEEDEKLAHQVIAKPLALRGFYSYRQQTIVNSFARARKDLGERGIELVNCTAKGSLRESKVLPYERLADVLAN